jgi:hypothetical protein
MAVITVPPFASRKHKWGWIALALALFLGLMSFVAVLEMHVDCRSQSLTLNGGGNLLLNGGGRILLNASSQCDLVMGDVRIPLPAWAQAIIN